MPGKKSSMVSDGVISSCIVLNTFRYCSNSRTPYRNWSPSMKIAITRWKALSDNLQHFDERTCELLYSHFVYQTSSSSGRRYRTNFISYHRGANSHFEHLVCLSSLNDAQGGSKQTKWLLQCFICLKINNISYFQLTRLDRKTLDCISTLDYESCTSKSEVEKKYNELMGYNPSSSLGNKQQCKQCGNSVTLVCIGHPVKIDIKQDYLLPYAEKAINALMKVFCYDCEHSVEQMERSDQFHSLPTHPTWADETTIDIPEVNAMSSCSPRSANLTLFLSKFNEDDLLSFGLSKQAIMDTVIHELVLLPLCLQPSDPRTTKVAHTKHHLELISVLRTQSKDQNAKVKAIIDKLMIAKSDERTSHIQMCEGKEGVFGETAIGKELGILHELFLSWRCWNWRQVCNGCSYDSKDRCWYFEVWVCCFSS